LLTYTLRADSMRVRYHCMLVIRLQRTGRKNSPTFRMVLAEHSAPVKGKFIEVFGHYLPTRDPFELDVKEDRIRHWVSMGAIPSDTVARLLVRHGMADMEKFAEKYTKKKSKNAVEEAPPPPPPPPAEAPATPETPAEPVQEEPPEAQTSPAEAKEPAATEEAPSEPAAPDVEETSDKPPEEGDSETKE